MQRLYKNIISEQAPMLQASCLKNGPSAPQGKVKEVQVQHWCRHSLTGVLRLRIRNSFQSFISEMLCSN